ncbi:MAG: SCE4755 family polysaccharide monooxygenase-like protein [Polyangiaceae bacterium]
MLTGSALLGGCMLAGSASAHFRLISPGNVVMQSSDGSPQKMGPCGNESPQTPSNVVTRFEPGATVTIQLQETVFHPGHYRAALAVNSPSELPADPVVTAGSTACGSAAIQSTPMYPVLADGMLQHTQMLTGTQTFQVKLPTNVTCTNCTLQIVEFMSSHAAPCFYYHCAKIAIGPDGGTTSPDAGSDASGGSGGTTGTGGATGSGGTAGSGAAGGGTAGSGTGGTAGSGGTGGAATGGAAGGGASAGSAGAGGSKVVDSNDVVGCACRIGAANRDAWKGVGAFLALVWVARKRRARSRDATHPKR